MEHVLGAQGACKIMWKKEVRCWTESSTEKLLATGASEHWQSGKIFHPVRNGEDAGDAKRETSKFETGLKRGAGELGQALGIRMLGTFMGSYARVFYASRTRRKEIGIVEMPRRFGDSGNTRRSIRRSILENCIPKLVCHKKFYSLQAETWKQKTHPWFKM